MSLGVEADDPGTLRVDGNSVWLQRRSVRVYDGFDVTWIGCGDSTLTVTLQSANPGAPGNAEPDRWRFEIVPTDLGSEPRIFTLANSDTRLTVRRTPGDILRVNTERPHLVFEPGERLSAAVALNIAPTQRKVEATLEWKLCPARSNSAVQTGSCTVSLAPDQLTAATTSLDIPLPEQEGVYDVRLTLAGRGLRTETGTLQLVVLSPEPLRPFDTGADDRIIDEFEPSRPGMFRRVERRNALHSINKPLGRLLGIDPRPATFGDVDPSEPKIEWNAYKLRLKHPEQPHRLVVSLPKGKARSLGISLLEPNAAGQLTPLGLDSGVIVHGDALPSAADGATREESEILTHDVLFWPKIKEPILMLHDMGTGGQVDIGRITAIEVGSLANKTPAAKRGTQGIRRLVGPYLHKPCFPENFGATEVYDVSSRRSLDDWVTFYSGAERLIRYLQRENCNSVLIAALADGSTIYPSAILEPTPRYDTGVYSSAGHDPLRKDVLELLYRMFDRDGLVLIPELQFSSPLPALEQILAQGRESDRGIELIGRDGRSWRSAEGTVGGLAPCYNPLNLRVQQAMLDVVQELVDRYRGHESFQGVAVELTMNGYMQFPGLEWGYDDETVARFELATGVQVPQADGSERYARRFEFLTKQERGRWVKWRCEELARFHRQMSEVVTSAGPDVQFFLSGTNVLRGFRSGGDMDESVKSRGGFTDLLPPRGLDFSRYSDIPRFVVLRPVLSPDSQQPSVDLMNDQANHSTLLDRAFNTARPGVLVYHPPYACRIAAFDTISPWEPAFTWLAAQPSKPGAEAREPIVHALAATDAQVLFDGGWMIPLGQEEHVRSVRETILSLPPAPFHLSKSQQQPAVVRVAWHLGQTWCYVINESPEAINVDLSWSCPAGTHYRVLPRGEELPLDSREENGSRLAISLPAYGLWAFVIDDATARLTDVHVKMPEAALAALDQRVHQLGQRITEAHAAVKNNGPQKETLLANPGFEAVPAVRNELPGWETPLGNAALWALDNDNPRSGKSSLMLAADGDDGASLCSRLSLVENRLVNISAWLRSDRDETDVRLVFEATLGKEVFRENSDVRVDTRWRRYQFQVTGIPLRPWDDARVRVEMRGPGRIWIDDVDIQTQQLSQEDLLQLTRLYSAVTLAWDQQRYTDCARLLDSYWGRIVGDSIPQAATQDAAEPAPRRETSRLRSLFKR